MELVSKYKNLEKAERLALVFGLNLQHLLENAGDILLSNKEFPQAIVLYKLSRVNIFPNYHLYTLILLSFRFSLISFLLPSIIIALQCRLLKSVLKFASAGHTTELLSYVSHCLAPPSVTELSIATRIHLSNLSVMAFTELTLRASALQSTHIHKQFS